MGASGKPDDRRRSVRVRLTGAALISRQAGKDGAVPAVLDNVNRVGAGLHSKQQLKTNETVTYALAVIDPEGKEHQEKPADKVAWTNIATSPEVADHAHRLAAAVAFEAGRAPALGELVGLALEALERDLRRRKVPIPKAATAAKGPKSRRA